MEKENISTMIEPKAGELDATDIKILTCLQDNSRLTTKELAAKVHLSTTPVFILTHVTLVESSKVIFPRVVTSF